MALQAIPTEILQEICSYNDPKSLSVTNKYIRSAALRYVLDTIRFTAKDKKLEAILEFISKDPRNACQIRKVVLDLEWPFKYPRPRLVTLLKSLEGLRALECSDSAAMNILDSWEEAPKVQWTIVDYDFCEKLGHGSQRLQKNLFLQRLTSLEVLISFLPTGNISDESSYLDGSDAAEMELHNRYLGETVKFLTNAGKYLKRLRVSHNYGGAMVKIPPSTAHQASLQELSLLGIQFFDPQVFRIIGEATDLGELRTLMLPIVPAIDYVWLSNHGLLFRQLKRLFLPLLHAGEWANSTVTQLTRFLTSLPPLEELTLFGDYHPMLSNVVFTHHNTLKTLILEDQPNRIYPPVISLQKHQLQAICQLRHLSKLQIRLLRSEEEAWKTWSLLRSLPLQELILILDPSDYMGPLDGSLMDYHPRRTFLLNAAIDETLARAIYECYNLDTLELSIEHRSQQGFNAEISGEGAQYKILLSEISRTHTVTRSYGEVVVHGSDAKMSRVEEPNHSSPLMAAFRELWPPTPGGDWKKDWRSKPFVVDDGVDDLDDMLETMRMN